MANEILVSNAGDLLTSEVLANEFLMLLADRDASLLTHPALMRKTAANLTSNVVKVPHIGIGYDLLTATTPGSEVANNALSDGSTSVTIVMRALRRNIDDLAGGVASILNPVVWAQDAAIAVSQTLISLVANVGDDFSSTVGTSGADLSWTDFNDAVTTLQIAKVDGQFLSILHPRQIGDLRSDTFSMGGAVASTSIGSAIDRGTGAYWGRYLGVDVYMSSHVPTADSGANRAGCMVGMGGIAWADAELPPVRGEDVFNLGRARLEKVRQGHYLAESWITAFACGVSRAIDAAGVTIKTDA